MVDYLPDRVFPPLSVDFCLIPIIMVVDHPNKIFSPISLDLCLNMTILVNKSDSGVQTLSSIVFTFCAFYIFLFLCKFAFCLVIA